MSWIEEQTRGRVPYKFGDRIMPYSRKKSYLLCPTCGKPARFTCLCPIADAECADGHHWHLRYEGKQAFVARGEGIH